MTAEGCMVQGSPACSIWNIHIAEEWDQGFSAADSLIGCSDVKRRLPVLVSGVHVRRVFQQNLDSLLQEVITCRCVLFGFVKQWEITTTTKCVIENKRNIRIPHCRRPQLGAEEWATCYLWHLLWHLQVRRQWLSDCLRSNSYMTSSATFQQKPFRQ